MAFDPEAFLTDLNDALRDRPLDLTKPEDRALYVPVYDQVAPEEDPVRLLANQITRSHSSSSAHLFSGYRGSGKSTELRRLQNSLRERGYHVAYVDLLEYLDLYTPVGIGDFLLDIAGAYDDALRDGTAGVTVPGESFWVRLGGWFKSWGVDEVTADLGVDLSPTDSTTVGGSLGIKATMKDNKVFRRRLADHLARRMERVANDMAEFIKARTAELLDLEPAKGVVLLVDSTEQLRDTDETGDTVKSSVRTLFTQEARRLRLPGLHTVFSVPPDLVIREPEAIQAHYDGATFRLTAVTVEKRVGDQREQSPQGIAAMREVLTHRHGEVAKLFDDPAQLDELIVWSGGNLRNLLSLVRSVIDKTFDVPTSRRAVDGALKQAADEFGWLTDEEKGWLRPLADTGRPLMRTDADRNLFADFLDRQVVLPYRNGEEWFDVAPPVRRHLSL